MRNKKIERRQPDKPFWNLCTEKIEKIFVLVWEKLS